MNVRIEVVARPEGDDDALGGALVDLVTRAAERGGAPPAAAVARAGGVDLVRLDRGVSALPRFVAALSRSSREPLGVADAVGLVGSFPTRGSDGSPGPLVALVFLEWPDCRWWYWRALLDPDRRVRPDTATWSRAVDGDRLPPRLGRWWTLGRRANLGLLEIRRAEPLVH